MSEIEVESADVIRLILQYLKENNLNRTLQCLQEESQITLDCVEGVEAFSSTIQQGKWDQVIQVVGSSSLQEETLFMVFEQIICEMMELQEFEVARQFLRETSAMLAMKRDHPERHKRLEQICKQQTTDPKILYASSTKEKRRALIAQAMLQELKSAPPGRLMAILGMAMKWQQHQGLLTPGMKFDLFRGVVLSGEEKEECVGQIARQIQFASKTYAECAAFSPDGSMLVTGSVDGIIEVWDWLNGSLRLDLEYQQKEEFMMHEKPILAIAFSSDSDCLASGSEDGQLKVWNLRTGECVKKIDHAHEKGICCMQFSFDNGHILTGSFDNTARIHGLRTKSTIRVFRGHTSYVNTAIYAAEGARVVTGSSDGKLKVWDSRTAECIRTFTPPPPACLVTPPSFAPAINCVIPASKGTGDDLIFVCAKTSVLYLMNLSGHVLKTFFSGKQQDGDFVAACKSIRGEYLYCAGEDNTLYCFSNSSGKLEAVVTSLHTKDVTGIAHHPHFSILASWGFDGVLNFLKP